MKQSSEAIDTWVYDVNIFSSEEDGHLDRLQPSIWYEKSNGASDRVYLQAFSIPHEEVRAMRKLFPEEGWDWDFFLTLEEFYSITSNDNVPLTREILKNLPDFPDQLVLDKFEYDQGEIIWQSADVKKLLVYEY